MPTLQISFVRLLLILSIGTSFYLLGSAQMLKAEDGESKLATPIPSLPYSITSPGVYSVNTEFPALTIASGAAIVINANNVTLELNGHSIFNSNAANTAKGVYAYDHKNVTVRNGTMRGFSIGIDLLSSVTNGSLSNGNVVEDLVVNGSSWLGIRVWGNANVVRRCTLTNSGGTASNDGNGYGLTVQAGTGNRVFDNDITGVTATDATHLGYGIFIGTATDTFIVNNRIGQSKYGIYYASGSTGKYRDNIISDAVTYSFVLGSDAGGNVMSGDGNGDGMADSWETTYFNTTSVNPNGLAPNGSGLTNIQMYLLGLSPLVAQVSSSLAPVNGVTVNLSGTQAILSWSSSGSGIQFYCVQTSINSGTTWFNQAVVPGSSLSLSMSGLTLGAAYSFRVVAVDSSGFSSPSTPDSAPLITLTTPSGAVLVP